MDLKLGLNRVHVMMCSNNGWFIDAGTTDGERRYFVGEVSNNHQQDKVFFGKFHREMYDNGQSGLRAMLHDLLARDITDWAPRGEVPVSRALVEQKLHNLDPMGKWWFSLLDNAELGDIGIEEDANWVLDEEVKVLRDDVRSSFDNYCLENGIRGKKQMERFFWKELKAYCPLLDITTQVRVAPGPDRYDVKVAASDGRASGIWLPSLAACRAELSSLLGSEDEWAVKL
jgi:hypothetical protein